MGLFLLLCFLILVEILVQKWDGWHVIESLGWVPVDVVDELQYCPPGVCIVEGG
jgi:hypothetical protein